MLRGLITQNYPPAPGQQTPTERHGKSVAGINIKHLSGNQGG